MSHEEVQSEMVKTDDPEVFRTALQIMRERRMHAELCRVAEHDRWPEDHPVEGDPSGSPA